MPDIDTTEGLTTAEASRLLTEHGPNRMPLPPATPRIVRLAAQMGHLFALLFWCAAVLAFIAGMPQLGVAIIVVVVINGLFAFAQEERAQHAAEGLRRMLPRLAHVIRDGRLRDINADELVPGDVVVLAEGDRISADMSIRRVTLCLSTLRRSPVRACRSIRQWATRSSPGASCSRARPARV